MTAEPFRPAAGKFFEYFYLMALLGEGGMSEVYLAYDFFDPGLVALKFLQAPLTTSRRTVARMKREGEIYRSLRHPSIVNVLAQKTAPGVEVYLVLEVVRGRQLDAVLDDLGGPLTVPRAVRVLEDTAAALNTAHRRGIIHRDVKPQNIMVGPDDRATLLDFGIAHADDELSGTITDSLAGTMVYAAPEQRRGEDADHRSDIYSLGAVLYEMLTGQRVLEPSDYDEMIMFRASTLPPPSARARKVPPEMDRICRKLLADDPTERYQELRELLVEIGMLRIELTSPSREALFGDEQERDLDAATKALRAGKVEEAEPLVTALATHPEPGLEAEIFHALGRVQAQTGRPGQATRAFRRALEHRPEAVEILVDLALLSIRLGKFEEARAALLGAPAEAREHHLVTSLFDLLGALEDVPPGVVAGFSDKGAARAFQRAVRELA